LREMSRQRTLRILGSPPCTSSLILSFLVPDRTQRPRSLQGHSLLCGRERSKGPVRQAAVDSLARLSFSKARRRLSCRCPTPPLTVSLSALLKLKCRIGVSALIVLNAGDML